MRKTIVLILLALLITDIARSQKNAKIPLEILLFNNSTLLPGNLLPFPLHPGIAAGTYFKPDENKKSDIYFPLRFAYFYHHYSQYAIQLYSGIGYRYDICKSGGVEVQLDAGYLHSIPDIQVFEQNGTNYTKKSFYFRPQAMAGAEVGFFYKLKRDDELSPKLNLNYQFYLQVPFVKNYVPLLPNTALLLGATFFLNSKSI